MCVGLCVWGVRVGACTCVEINLRAPTSYMVLEWQIISARSLTSRCAPVWTCRGRLSNQCSAPVQPQQRRVERPLWSQGECHTQSSISLAPLLPNPYSPAVCVIIYTAEKTTPPEDGSVEKIGRLKSPSLSLSPFSPSGRHGVHGLHAYQLTRQQWRTPQAHARLPTHNRAGNKSPDFGEFGCKLRNTLKQWSRFLFLKPLGVDENLSLGGSWSHERGLQSKAGQMTGETFWVVSLQHHSRQG